MNNIKSSLLIFTLLAAMNANANQPLNVQFSTSIKNAKQQTIFPKTTVLLTATYYGGEFVSHEIIERDFASQSDPSGNGSVTYNLNQQSDPYSSDGTLSTVCIKIHNTDYCGNLPLNFADTDILMNCQNNKISDCKYSCLASLHFTESDLNEVNIDCNR